MQLHARRRAAYIWDMSDEQDMAESVDEEMVGGDAVTSDEVGAFDDAPDRPVGLPFADADITDESLAERVDARSPTTSTMVAS